MSTSPSPLHQGEIAQFPVRHPIRHNEHLVGFLIAEEMKGGGNDYPSYRFAALDRHFILLDGSHFTAPHRAAAAVARLGRFVGQPPAANEA